MNAWAVVTPKMGFIKSISGQLAIFSTEYEATQFCRHAEGERVVPVVIEIREK